MIHPQLNLSFVLILLIGLPAWGQFSALPMQKMYHGEHLDDRLFEVIYFQTPETQAHFRLSFKNGLIYDSDGNLFSSEGKKSLYVMDLEGNFYSARNEVSVRTFYNYGVLHHSSFLAGSDVAGAGIWLVVDGRLLQISNESGHYQPGPQHLDQTVEQLKKHLPYKFLIEPVDEESLNSKCLDLLEQGDLLNL